MHSTEASGRTYTKRLITKSELLQIGLVEEAGGNWQKITVCGFHVCVKEERAQREAEGCTDSKEEANQNNSLWCSLKNKACFINQLLLHQRGKASVCVCYSV